MELIVSKTDFLRELHLVQGIAQHKPSLPILGNVRLEAESESLRLVATDLEVGLRSSCPATVKKPGVLTVPARKLFEIVRSLPDEPIRITTSRNIVQVAAEPFDLKLTTLPGEDFPVLPNLSAADSAALPRA